MFQKIKMDHALLSRHFFHTAVKLIAKEKNPSHFSLGELLFLSIFYMKWFMNEFPLFQIDHFLQWAFTRHIHNICCFYTYLYVKLML